MARCDVCGRSDVGGGANGACRPCVTWGYLVGVPAAVPKSWRASSVRYWWGAAGVQARGVCWAAGARMYVDASGLRSGAWASGVLRGFVGSGEVRPKGGV